MGLVLAITHYRRLLSGAPRAPMLWTVPGAASVGLRGSALLGALYSTTCCLIVLVVPPCVQLFFIIIPGRAGQRCGPGTPMEC